MDPLKDPTTIQLESGPLKLFPKVRYDNYPFQVDYCREDGSVFGTLTDSGLWGELNERMAQILTRYAGKWATESIPYGTFLIKTNGPNTDWWHQIEHIQVGTLPFANGPELVIAKFLKPQPLGPKQKAWVDALRSGEWKQTTGVLQAPRQESYCCLGVACKVAEPEVQTSKAFGLTEDGIVTTEYVGLAGTTLYDQQAVIEHYQFAQCAGSFCPTNLDMMNYGLDYIADLPRLNDKLHFNFSQIADYIEKYASQLFKNPA